MTCLSQEAPWRALELPSFLQNSRTQSSPGQQAALPETGSVAPPPVGGPKPAGSFMLRFSMGYSLRRVASSCSDLTQLHLQSYKLTKKNHPRDQIPGHYSRRRTPLWSTAAVSNQLKSAPRFCRPPLCRHPGGLPGPVLAMSKTQEMLMEMLKWHAKGILVNKATLRGWGRRLSSLPWRELQ